MKRHLVVMILGLCLPIFGHTQDGFSQTTPSQTAPKRTKASADGAVDKALQKIWDGWATLDPARQKQYYAQGPHVFFDIASLKYDSWDEYQPGVSKVLAGYKAARFTVNEDAQIHKSGEGYLDYCHGCIRHDRDVWQAGSREFPVDSHLRKAARKMANRA